MENRKVKQILSLGWSQRKNARYKERVKEAECSVNIMYLCMEMRK
jgi:hypothetical protein